MSNIFIGLNKTCLGVLERGDRDKYNETGLKEGGKIEMSTTVLHSRAALSLKYLPGSKVPAAKTNPFIPVSKSNIDVALSKCKLGVTTIEKK